MSCWNCSYQQRGGMTLLGYCKYFEKVGKEKASIPPHIVDKGCKFFEDKNG